MFDLDKKNALEKLDKSKIGEIDKDIKPLVNLINSKENYYTTSSCSGRICLTLKPKDLKKNEVEWLLEKHDTVSFDEIKKALSSYKKDDLWFEQEPFILHVACRTVDDARLLLDNVRAIGLKRSGIISLKKITVEVIGTEEITTIIGRDGRVFTEDNYLKLLIEQANYNFKRNNNKLKNLLSLLNN